MKKFIAAFLLALPAVTFAAAPPFFCQYGKVSNSYPEPEACTSENASFFQLKAEYKNVGWCKSSPGFSNDNMDGYIQIDVGKYLLIGNETRIKGDGDWLGNGNGKDELISFHDSVTGKIGQKNTNTEGNAYLYYTPFYGYSSGSGQVWVINNDHYLSCSKKDVYFQNKPYIGPSGYNPANITGQVMNIQLSTGFPLYYQIDSNSKAAKEGTTSKITIYARYANNSSRRDVVGTATVSQPQGPLLIQRNGYSIDYGTVKFYAEINDGTYSSDEVYLGSYTYTPSMPSACAQACPASLGSYRSQCQGTSSACNYRVW